MRTRYSLAGSDSWHTFTTIRGDVLFKRLPLPGAAPEPEAEAEADGTAAAAGAEGAAMDCTELDARLSAGTSEGGRLSAGAAAAGASTAGAGGGGGTNDDGARGADREALLLANCEN